MGFEFSTSRITVQCTNDAFQCISVQCKPTVPFKHGFVVFCFVLFCFCPHLKRCGAACPRLAPLLDAGLIECTAALRGCVPASTFRGYGGFGPCAPTRFVGCAHIRKYVQHKILVCRSDRSVALLATRPVILQPGFR